MDSKEIILNKVVKIDKEEKTLTILERLFYYNNGFHGATGHIVTFIDKEYIDETIQDHNIVNYCDDAGLDNEIIDEILHSSKWDKIDFMFECYNKDIDNLYEIMGVNPNDYPIIEHTSCGRIFGKNNDFPLEKDLEKIVNNFEGGDEWANGDVVLQYTLQELKEKNIEFVYKNNK
jgi:hypothetical protein